MSVCEYNVNDVERTCVVPVFYQAFLVGNEHAYFVFAGNVCSPADCRHCTKTVHIIPKLREQSLCKTNARILDIPLHLVLQFVGCFF